MTLLLSRYPMSPINKLINIMARLASGDFSARINLPNPWNRISAFQELSESFNTMAEEMQNTELLRSDFINNFSHEFKTPIVSIAGFAKLLKREQLTPQQAEYVKIIEEESLRLSQMATNVLNLTKVENQTILTNVTTYNLSEQLRSCILLLTSKWEKKELEFSLDFPEYEISGNEELLKHMWINLLDNAIKFSPQGGVVTVTLRERPGFIEVGVQNTGLEIPPDKQKKIFNKFYQIDESHASQGNGIGLAIVRKVTDLHSGSISVQSDHSSTTFTILLPRNKEDSK
jgi:signal transduction histidine kinase